MGVTIVTPSTGECPFGHTLLNSRKPKVDSSRDVIPTWLIMNYSYILNEISANNDIGKSSTKLLFLQVYRCYGTGGLAAILI